MKVFIFSFLLMTNVSQAQSTNVNQLKAFLVKHTGTKNIPGMIAVLSEKKIIKQMAFTGVRRVGSKSLIVENDKFHLGSNTKAMTAALIAKLVDEGVLRWDMTLAEIFVDFTSMNEVYKKIRIDEILAHRAGFPKDFEGELSQININDNTDLGEQYKNLVNVLLKSEPKFAPGSTFHYSNIGYILLGEIIQKLTNKNFEKILAEKIFAPLQMKSCGFGLPQKNLTSEINQPIGHKIKAGKIVSENFDNPLIYNSTGRVHCSVDDWLKFLHFEMDGYNNVPNLFISKNSFSKLFTTYPGQEYTYGGWIKVNRGWGGGDVFTHNGTNTRNFSLAWLAPNKKRVFITASNYYEQDSMEKNADEVISELIKMADVPWIEMTMTKQGESNGQFCGGLKDILWKCNVQKSPGNGWIEVDATKKCFHKIIEESNRCGADQKNVKTINETNGNYCHNTTEVAWKCNTEEKLSEDWVADQKKCYAKYVGETEFCK